MVRWHQGVHQAGGWIGTSQTCRSTVISGALGDRAVVRAEAADPKSAGFLARIGGASAEVAVRQAAGCRSDFEGQVVDNGANRRHLPPKAHRGSTGMPRKRRKDTLDHLRPAESAQVLRELLKRHRHLRGEANEIAESLIDDVSIEAVAEDVAHLVASVGIEELGDRAGKQSWGYVEPGEAAWKLLEESIEDIRSDMKRRIQAGKRTAAEKICQGTVLGLHETNETNSDGALGWAPDFPAEAAAWTLSLLLEAYPQSQRRAAAKRIIGGVEEEADSWVEMLERAVNRSATKKQRKRR